MGHGEASMAEEAFGASVSGVTAASSAQTSLVGAFSLAFAQSAHLAPIRRNMLEGILTIAVTDAVRVPTLTAVFKFLLEPAKIEFEIVSSVGLEEAQARFRAQMTGEEPAKPKGRRPVAGGLSGKSVVASPGTAKAGFFKLGGVQAKPSAPLPGYAEMGAALQALISILAQDRLRQTTQLPAVQARVRHCQLLASRIGLAERQVDAVVLAAWLSGTPGASEILTRMPALYGLNRILTPAADESSQVEARVLGVVRAYEGFVRESADEARGVSAVRRKLVSELPAGTPDVIEPFLQILMDEQFLASLERKSGAILLADPAEQVTATLVVPLTADGYMVETVSTVESVRSRFAVSPPDMLIMAAGLPGGSVPGLCRELKQQEATRHVPVLILTEPTDGRQSAEFLRAGADDVLANSAGPELTLLKVDRLMGGRARERVGTEGVTGSLRDMALVDMVQILAAGGRNVEVRLRHDRNQGRLYIREGAIIHAVCGAREGADAFFELMRWHEGTFVTVPCEKFPPRTVQETMMGLLMEGARLADERHEAGR
jgi:CheY-like chemotaxis protein